MNLFMDIFDRLKDIDPAIWGFAASASLVMLLVGVIVMPLVIILMPADYFVARRRIPVSSRTRLPFLTRTLTAVRNLVGVFFVCIGLVMIVTPGQGLLTLLAGLILMNFPGKYKFEKRIISKKSVYKTANWLRRKANREALTLPEA